MAAWEIVLVVFGGILGLYLFLLMVAGLALSLDRLDRKMKSSGKITARYWFFAVLAVGLGWLPPGFYSNLYVAGFIGALLTAFWVLLLYPMVVIIYCAVRDKPETASRLLQWRVLRLIGYRECMTKTSADSQS